MKLGVDIYSLRYNDWDAYQHLEYASSIGLDIVHFSDMGPFESLDDGYLASVRAKADCLGLDIEVGMDSICPTSRAFHPEGGTAPQQVRRMLDIAAQLRSKVLRCYLGTNADRHTELPLATHINGVVETCQAVRDMAMDLGITIAIENHAGDLQARELRAMIEAAGPEYVGACIDPGNAMWVHENPFVTLDYLAPYVATSHARDTAVWSHPKGAAVQWVAMGEGGVGIADWARAYQERCPNAPFTMEIITGFAPRILNYFEAEYWDAFPETPAWEFARFEQLVRQGQPFDGTMLVAPRGMPLPDEYLPAFALQQRIDLERSVAFCHKLGIGERA